ncbi:sulfite exporter TauE/SafE family protein [Halalkalicoccus subterraneus]|uniref:sulfite exporter TauE/SafE family protein n=1 Tax=Halalkalicoccus subterraneus TaxID=2675002 RepID=UPI000EFBD199|nr:sulfite exporter TauE/SafE family protein [Halalkalicoccus subterraneus]
MSIDILHLITVSSVPIYTDLVVFFLIGLLGGAHCIGMCGPLVTTYSKGMTSTEGTLTSHEVRQHGLFNVGRAVSYALIGGLFGLFGSVLYGTVSIVGLLQPIQAVLGVVIGALIIAAGLTRLFGYRQGSVEHATSKLGVSALFGRVYALLTSRINQWVNTPGIVGLGALHGLLPCMLLYPAYLYVLAHGSAVYGIVALGALGIGTIPSVFLYGTVIGSIGLDERLVLNRALGIGFVILGYIPLAHGLALLGVPAPMFDLPFYQPFGEYLPGGHNHH